MTPIRRLYETEIECRVAQCGKNKDKEGAWCSILLYKDARVDQRILDEVFGPMNWQREHTIIGDRLYCTVSIWDEVKEQWIKKQDVGTESYTEKEKGQASDSFKRACFNVGIGRELYTAPKIFINLKEGEYKMNGDKVYPNINLDVKKILYDDKGNIIKLILVDSKGTERYSFGTTQKQQAPPPPPPPPQPEKELMFPGHAKWQPMLNSILAGKTTLEAVKKVYRLTDQDEHAAKEWLISNQQ